MKYRKKSPIVDAVRWEPGHLPEAGRVIGWLMGNGCDFHHPSGEGSTTTLAIRKPGGEIWANPGDWIVRDARGEFHTYRPDTFDENYEPIGAAL